VVPVIVLRVKPMENVTTATESIEDFFAKYTRYLSTGDIEGLANCYNYPALAVTAMGCLAITEPQQSRDFFSQGQVPLPPDLPAGSRCRPRWTPMPSSASAATPVRETDPDETGI
jgi:hypothetical protein